MVMMVWIEQSTNHGPGRPSTLEHRTPSEACLTSKPAVQTQKRVREIAESLPSIGDGPASVLHIDEASARFGVHTLLSSALDMVLTHPTFLPHFFLLQFCCLSLSCARCALMLAGVR
eukprot:628077-Rhodomonas_salina.4